MPFTSAARVSRVGAAMFRWRASDHPIDEINFGLPFVENVDAERRPGFAQAAQCRDRPHAARAECIINISLMRQKFGVLLYMMAAFSE